MDNEEQKTKKVRQKRSFDFLHWGRSAEGDWKIIFIVAAIFALCSIALSTFIFIKIDKGEIFLVEKTTEDSAESLNVEKLKETNSYYKNKALEFERIKNSNPAHVDPSL